MGVYIRKDSKFFWLWLEGRHGKKGFKERTDVLATPTNRPLAERVYQERMRQLAETRAFAPRRLQRPRQDGSGWCYIYFITDGTDRVKIGRAVNVRNRLRAMQTAQAERLQVLAAFPGHISLEALIHTRFRAARIGKSEWFRLTPPVVAFIERIASGIDPTAELANIPVLSEGPEIHSANR